MPEIPRVQNCCCCSLNTGGLIMGWLGAVGSLIMLLLLSSTMFLNYDEFVSTHFGNDSETMQTLMELKPFVYAIIGIGALIYVVHFIVSVMLIRGTIKRVARLLKPWLILEAISIVFLFIGTLCSLPDFQQFFSSFFGLALSIYLWICIYSLFKFIQSEDYNQQMANNQGMHKV